MNTGDIRRGMTVHSADGHKLGKVISVEADGFEIEKGFFFKKEQAVSLTDVADVRGDDVILRADHDDLSRGEPAPEAATAGSAPVRESAEHVSVPVAEEQIEAVTRRREAGAVHVRKDVSEETRTVDVPVRTEEVEVSRVQRDDRTPVAEAGAFQEEEVVIPLHEEEVEVEKRPVIKEEVRVDKRVVEHEQRVAEPVRSEHVEIETEGDVHRRDDDDPERRS